MLDLLQRRFGHGQLRSSHVVLEEVAPSTGFRGVQRFADALVLGLWPSSGMLLHGFELKATKGDLKRELSDLKKHAALARYCDTWSLLLWEDQLIVDQIPADWGIWVTRPGTHERQLRVVRAAKKRTPEPWPRQFVASLVRNAYEQSPGAAWTARLLDEAAAHQRASIERHAENTYRQQIEKLGHALYGREWYGVSFRNDTPSLVAAMTERITTLVAAQSER